MEKDPLYILSYRQVKKGWFIYLLTLYKALSHYTLFHKAEALTVDICGVADGKI